VFVYDTPPPGEIGFPRALDAPYYREVWQFTNSKHFVSRHAMTVATDYESSYVDATYQGAAGLAATFDRIIALPYEQSDNAHRMARVRTFAATHLQAVRQPRLLDIGAGLGVFPYAVRQAGWTCVAIDPDPRAVEHMHARVGIEAICGDFMKVEGIGIFDVVTLNKVLEHVEDPVPMLERVRSVLSPGGFVYIEVPDGEMAARVGQERQEFFIEHFHIFSFASTVMLASRAGFTAVCIERLQEPSTKFTLRGFLVMNGSAV
jgi:SAM-dependent methyltransferase